MRASFTARLKPCYVEAYKKHSMGKKQRKKTVASYTVDIVEEDGAYCVSVPALPGCFIWGKTLSEAERHAKEAIAGFIEALQKAGQPVPVDRARTKLHVRKKINVGL